MEIKLDKLEETILVQLREETGKSDEDIVKLALYELNRKMAEDKVQKAQPITIPMPYPVYPENPAPYPVYPLYPLYPPYPQPTYPNPWDTSPTYKIWCSQQVRTTNNVELKPPAQVYFEGSSTTLGDIKFS